MISARLLLWAALVGVSSSLPNIMLNKSFFLWLPLSLQTLINGDCILLQLRFSLHFSHGIALLATDSFLSQCTAHTVCVCVCIYECVFFVCVCVRQNKLICGDRSTQDTYIQNNYKHMQHTTRTHIDTHKLVNQGSSSQSVVTFQMLVFRRRRQCLQSLCL